VIDQTKRATRTIRACDQCIVVQDIVVDILCDCGVTYNVDRYGLGCCLCAVGNCGKERIAANEAGIGSVIEAAVVGDGQRPVGKRKLSWAGDSDAVDLGYYERIVFGVEILGQKPEGATGSISSGDQTGTAN